MIALRPRAAQALLALVGAVAACGPGPARDIIPTLPVDGDAHTAKPPAEAAPPPVRDPWDRKDLITAPTAPAPTAITLPPIDRFTLANGLQVIVVTNPELPVVSMQP